MAALKDIFLSLVFTTLFVCIPTTVWGAPNPITASTATGGPTYAVIHYFRADGDYGDHTTGDYNDFWGLHLWGDIEETIDWTNPKPFLGEDEYGRFAWVKLAPNATNVGLIVHRGDIKDGTSADRFFDPSVTPEIWLQQDDANEYTSQADAQGFVTVHYHRDDGDYGTPSSDFNTFWGLHLWGDAITPSEGTTWTAPKAPTGINGYGAFWDIQVVDSSQPVNFIIHRGDVKDPGPDESFIPADIPTVWKQSGDEEIYLSRGAAQNFATIHYHRADGDYGDATSPDFNNFWGLHVWAGAASPNPSWQDPIRPAGQDQFGIFFEVDLVPGATELAYILHRGDTKDPGPDQFLDFSTYGYEVWQLSGENPSDPAEPHYVLPISTAGDADGDGVPDEDDICPGFDDNIDTDGDSAPDGCDVCPLDELNDADGDGVCGDVDVCDGDDTVDTDNDSVPDDCDACPVDAENDADGDGFCESADNCPLIANADQSNNDSDNDGDACDADDDNDSIDDDIDNCPLIANTDQSDYDDDGAGDVCDMDVDGDGVLDNVDNCPYTIGTEVVDGTGCSINQYCACENNWKNHGAYVRCIAHTANDFISQGLIDQAEHGVITSEAGNLSCGAKK